MAIPKGIRANFNTMLRAAKNGDLACIETKRAGTDETVYIIAAIGRDANGGYLITPMGEMANGNPFEMYADPTAEKAA